MIKVFPLPPLQTTKVGLLIKSSKGLFLTFIFFFNSLIETVQLCPAHKAGCVAGGLSVLLPQREFIKMRCIFCCWTLFHRNTESSNELQTHEQIAMHPTLAIQSNHNKICMVLQRVLQRAIPIWKDFSLFVSPILKKRKKKTTKSERFRCVAVIKQKYQNCFGCFLIFRLHFPILHQFFG